jgi:hypothetical protein
MRHHSIRPILLLCGALAAACNVFQSTAGPAAVIAPDPNEEPPTPLPHAEGSLKFAVFGDFGTATRQQFEMADRMFKVHSTFPYELVLLAGDNLYGAERPQDFENKFAKPYKPLLDAGVKFYAALGNHDDRNQRFYKLFNMEEKQYYSFKAPKQNVRFFALESTYPEPDQIKWLEDELKGSNEDWKIAYFHHPLYSSGARHGSDVALRDVLEPLFVKYNVSVVFTGHDHFYERIKPQKGIAHFVVGSGGKLAPGDIDRNSPITARGFDQDYAFLVAEIVKDELYFQAISRTGRTFDSGKILRRKEANDTGTPAGSPIGK